MNKKVKLIKTTDGSVTLLVEEKQITYHSVHGAESESRHVFIRNGLHYFKNHTGRLNILEVGLGTGLNFLLTAHDESIRDKQVQYTALEPFPLPCEIVTRMKGSPGYETTLFQQLHQADFGEEVKVHDGFFLLKLRQTLQQSCFAQQFHLVYYDAFAPTAQPELWTEEVFKQLYAIMFTGAILVTYCAKGEVKRVLKRCGFQVETLPGPPRKREMIRAVKPS